MFTSELKSAAFLAASACLTWLVMASSVKIGPMKGPT
jgi:hypothetical protein